MYSIFKLLESLWVDYSNHLKLLKPPWVDYSNHLKLLEPPWGGAAVVVVAMMVEH
jgi:hypothetical protein